MVYNKDVLSIFRQDVNSANSAFARAAESGDWELIASTMHLCNKAEWKLLEEEQRIRQRKIRMDNIALDQEDNLSEGVRLFLITQFEGITGRKISE